MSYNKSEHVTSRHVTNYENATVESSESTTNTSNSSANLNGRNVRIVRSSNKRKRSEEDLASVVADAMSANLSSSSTSKAETTRIKHKIEKDVSSELDDEDSIEGEESGSKACSESEAGSCSESELDDNSFEGDETDSSSTSSESEAGDWLNNIVLLEEDNELSSNNKFIDSFLDNFKSEKFDTDKRKDMIKKFAAQIQKNIDKDSDSDSDSDDTAPQAKECVSEPDEVASVPNESSRLKRKKENQSDSDSDSDVEPRAKKYIKTTSEATLNDDETSISRRKKEIDYADELNEFFDEIIEKKPKGAVHFIAMFSTPEKLERLIKKSTIDEINSEKISPLFLALAAKNKENAKILVQNGANLNCKDETESTPLHMACKHGFTSLVETMLKRRADFDINAVDEEGRTSLYIAIENSKIECACLLIDNGADTKITSYGGNNPLHLACNYGMKDAVKKLIGKVDVNCRNSKDSTPLMIVINSIYASNNVINIVKQLIEAGADIEAKEKNGNTLLLAAIKNNNEAASFYKLEIGTKIDVVIDFLIEKGAKIDATTKDGKTALHLACSKGNLKVVDKFIDKIDLETRDNEGNTPFLTALYFNHIESVNHLKNKGAKIDVTNNKGVTSLHKACENGLTEIVELLLEGNCDYNALDNDGDGALHFAFRGGNKECIDLIMKKGVDINRANKKGVTPFHVAASQEKEECFPLIIDLVDNIDAIDEKGNTPFLMALNKGNWKCASALLKLNANANVVNKQGSTPLLIACSEDECPEDLFNEILEKTDNPNIADSRGFTPLYEALDDENVKRVEKLLAKGVLITTKPNSDGESCLSLTIKGLFYHNNKAFKLCFKHFLKQDGNVDLYEEGDFQGTPLHYICKKRNTDIFEDLVEKLHAREFLKRNTLGELPLQFVFNNKDSADLEEEIGKFILFTLEGCIKEHVPAMTKEVQEKGLLGLSQYLAKNMQEFLDDAKSKGANPVESALILGDEILAKKMKDLLPKESYQNYVEELIKKFGPEAEEFFGALQFSYEINPVHMKDTAKIPGEKAEGVVMKDLLQMFEESYALNSDALIPNELRGELEEPIHDSLLKILKDFVNKVEKRTAYEGTPKNKEKLEIFYNSIEIAITHVIKKLQGIAGEEGQKRREEVLKTLLLEVENCGGKIFSISMDLYCQVVKGEVLDFETRLQNRLADLREVIFLSLIPSGEQNVHIKNYLMEKLGVELGIPGSEAATNFEDSYADRTINHEEAKKRFLNGYKPYSIASFVQQQCREDREFKDLCLDWIVENIEIPAEWNRAWDELIQNKGVVSSELEVKNMQEKMVKTLQLLGDIDWEDKKDLELSKKDIFKGCQESSIDPEVMVALLKKCGVFLDVESSVPVDEDAMELV